MNPRMPSLLAALLLLAAAYTAKAAPPVINEFVASHDGTDLYEFVEIFGDPSTSYSTLTIVQIEGDGSVAGTIDSATPVGSTNASGFWMTGFMTNVLENGTLTLLLVENFAGAVGNDLDTNNDGVLDSTPWGTILDQVAVNDGSGASDRTYGTPVLTAALDGGVFAPGGASRIPDGTDTGGTSDWVRNDFDLAGIPGFVGTPATGEALNTPGTTNQLFIPPPDPVINEFVFSHINADDHEYVEIFGDPNTDYSHLTIISIEGDGLQAGNIDYVIHVGTTDAAGYWTDAFLPVDALENGSNTLLMGEGFFGAVGQDLDTNNDGVLNTNPFSRLVDGVAVRNGNVTDLTYAVTLVQGYDGVPSTVGGASRLPNGTDTDAVADWVRNDFDGDGLAGFTGAPIVGEARNTPGTKNLTAVDLTPPVITVTMTPSVLWPPNHKMVKVCATVDVSDDREPAPTYVLTSVVSNEDPNGQGDGNTDVDIEGAGTGTDDLCFFLRAERSGGGDGREYTIVYTATDGAGNTMTGTAVVLVPHDQSGAALASVGFSANGKSFEQAADRYAIVIPSIPSVVGVGIDGEETIQTEGLDASRIDPFLAFVGNTWGVLRPERSEVRDVNGDQLADLVLYYPKAATTRLASPVTTREFTPGEPDIKVNKEVGLHFESVDGTQFLVPDIFGLGAPVSLVSGARPGSLGAPIDEARPARSEAVSIRPNPFNPSTTVSIEVAAPARVVLRVFDVRGTLVKTLRDEAMAAGHFDIPWDGRDDNGRAVSSGVYFVRFEAAGVRTTHRAVLLK
jgi:FlgD Ig-like domain